MHVVSLRCWIKDPRLFVHLLIYILLYPYPHATAQSVCSFLGSHCTDLGVFTTHTPPGHSTPDSCSILPRDWDRCLQRSTPFIPLWSPTGRVPWDNLRWTEDMQSGLETGQIPLLALPQEVAWEQQCLLRPPVQLHSQNSQHAHRRSLRPVRTLNLLMLVYELGSQLWHTGSVWGRKQDLLLNLMEIYFGSQDLKFPFFVSPLTGRCYVCAQSLGIALDETCTSSCQ